jgi:hypothetical protein
LHHAPCSVFVVQPAIAVDTEAPEAIATADAADAVDATLPTK